MTTTTPGFLTRRPRRDAPRRDAPRRDVPARRRHLRVVPDRAADAGEGQIGLGVVFALLVIGLGLIGSIMILSASSVSALERGGSSFSIFFRQCAWLAVGTVALAVVARIDYHRWAGLVPVLVLGSIGMLGLVLVPGIGVSVNGAQRWIGIGSLQIQPAEPVKFALIVFVAAIVARERIRGSDFRQVLRPVMSVTLIVALLLLLQPNLGTTILICCVVGTMLVLAGIPMRVIGVLAGLGVAATTFFALSADYRQDRLTGFLDPWANAGDEGYQTIQSLIGVATGGVTGSGLGQSRAKWGFLPEAHTDFVFSIIGEELGLFGSLAVIAMFVAMIVCAFRIAARSSDTFGTMLAAGVAVWFSVQAFVNVGAVLGLLPITGVPLPFVSFGGSSLLTTMIAAGVLFNVALQGRAPTNPVREQIKARRSENNLRAENNRRALAGATSGRR